MSSITINHSTSIHKFLPAQTPVIPRLLLVLGMSPQQKNSTPASATAMGSYLPKLLWSPCYYLSLASHPNRKLYPGFCYCYSYLPKLLWSPCYYLSLVCHPDRKLFPGCCYCYGFLPAQTPVIPRLLLVFGMSPQHYPGCCYCYGFLPAQTPVILRLLLVPGISPQQKTLPRLLLLLFLPAQTPVIPMLLLVLGMSPRQKTLPRLLLLLRVLTCPDSCDRQATTCPWYTTPTENSTPAATTAILTCPNSCDPQATTCPWYVTPTENSTPAAATAMGWLAELVIRVAVFWTNIIKQIFFY